MMGVGAGYAQSYDPFWDRKLETELKFTWLPKESDETGERIWFEHAYRFRRIITGPGEPVIEDRWLTVEQAMVKILKG
jgi:hypothetical protein